MKKILLSFGVALAMLSANDATAQGKLLIVHNSPDPLLATIDVWAEVASAGQYIKIADDVTYKSGYFFTIPSIPIPGANLVVHIKSSTSTASTDADLYSKALASVPTGNNVVVVNGLLTPSLALLKTNPDGVSNALDIDLINTGVQFSSSSMTSVEVAVHHGVVDAPNVYVQSFTTTIQQPARDTLVKNAVYRTTGAYSSAPQLPRRIHVIPSTNAQTNPAYPANGDALKSLGGKAAFLVTTGFLDATGTTTTNTFKVLAFVTDGSTLDGTLPSLEFPKEKIAGLVQVYHNASDPKLKALDLFVGKQKQVLGLNYRAGFQSAGFIQDFDYIIDLHRKDSTSSALNSTLRFDSDSVVAVLSGVLDTTMFTANPDGESRKFNFYIKKPAKVTSPTGTAELTVFHGATDGPTYSITAPGFGGLLLINGLKYGKFETAVITGGGTNIPVTLGGGTVVVNVNKPGTTVYKSYLVPLAPFDGKSVTICASGFVDSAANQNGASFRLFAGIPSSPFPTIIFLKDTSLINSINDPATSDLKFRMFPNPANSELVLAFDIEKSSNVTIDLLDINGRVVKSVVNSMFGNGSVVLNENISNLQSGLYIARVVSDKKTSTYKFNVIQ